VSELAAGFDAAFLAGGGGAPGYAPIFIVGLPRTGTTLLERVLGNHPCVRNRGELPDLGAQARWLADHACATPMDATLARRLRQGDHALLGERYAQHIGLAAGDARRPTDKNPDNYCLVGSILKALPDARVLHMRREPMDACFSSLKELFGLSAHAWSYDFADLAAHHGQYRRLMAHWHAVAPGRILDVDYESLVAAPEAEARRILAFCGLPDSPGMADVAGNRSAVATASSVQVRKPIHARNVGGWRRYEAQLAPLAARLADGEAGRRA
jgi:hypothetical protein